MSAPPPQRGIFLLLVSDKSSMPPKFAADLVYHFTVFDIFHVFLRDFDFVSDDTA